MSQAYRTLSASQFKATCLALLDDIAESGTTVVVTKRGKPVARLCPLEETSPPDLLGSVRYKREEDLLSPVEETWNVDR